MVTKISLICATALIFSSCASVDVARIKSLPPKGENCALDTYSDVTSVKKSYEVACVLGSSTGTSLFADKSIQHAIDLAKPEACKCGADAILVEHVSSTGMSLTGYGQGSASIKAIVYTGKK